VGGPRHGRALAEHLENGWLQLFCVDSVDAESWYAKWKWPGDRAWRHELYDRYILHEVLPFTRGRNANPYQIVTGASLGAYHAVNFAFRHPEVVRRVLGMSGLYDIKQQDNEHLSNVLWSRGIWHAFRPWNGRAHDWPWWQQMVRRYVGGSGGET
jgi:esterase/lipase superfamily enzyme